MPAPDWSEERHQTQLEYLPLITIMSATIHTLLGMRDFIVYKGIHPGYLLEFTIPVTIVAIVIALLSQARRIPLSYVDFVLLFSTYLLAVRPVATLMVDPSSHTLYTTVTIVGSAFSAMFVLFRWQFFLLNLTMIATWTIAGLFYLSYTQSVLMFIACVIASGFGYMILSKRIKTLYLIYGLQSRVENLEAILPMCSGCKKTRDEEGKWISVEEYIESQGEGLQVSHGLCEDCQEALYGDYLRKSGQGTSN